MKKNFLAIAILHFLFLTGCTTSTNDISFLINQGYTEKDAYIVTENGDPVFVDTSIAIDYYISNSVSSLSDYCDAATNAITNANKIDGVNITFQFTNPSSNFSFISEHEVTAPTISGVCNELSCTTRSINLFYVGEDTLASNQIFVDPNTNLIVFSTISFNLDTMSEIDTYKYTYIATHEIGHTLGLRDYDAQAETFAKGRSIMYGTYSSLYNFNDFTDEDKYLLRWHYTNGNSE